jgi:hypothetical protein
VQAKINIIMITGGQGLIHNGVLEEIASNEVD